MHPLQDGEKFLGMHADQVERIFFCHCRKKKQRVAKKIEEKENLI